MVSHEVCSDSLCGLLEHRGAQAALILGKEINCERHWGLQDATTRLLSEVSKNMLTCILGLKVNE